jgi:methylmalonyl-CoA mutase N-terminal domain/subunit
VRNGRDGPAVSLALDRLGDAAGAYGHGAGDRPHLMPLIVDAVRARATVGEIADTLAARWERYRPTA